MFIDPTKPLSTETLARAIDPIAWQAWDEKAAGSLFCESGKLPLTADERPWYVQDRERSIENAERLLAAYVSEVGAMMPPAVTAPSPYGTGATQSPH